MWTSTGTEVVLIPWIASSMCWSRPSVKQEPQCNDTRALKWSTYVRSAVTVCESYCTRSVRRSVLETLLYRHCNCQDNARNWSTTLKKHTNSSGQHDRSSPMTVKGQWLTRLFLTAMHAEGRARVRTRTTTICVARITIKLFLGYWLIW